MDSLDIEAGTVICVETDNKAWVKYDGCMYTHEEFAGIVRSTHDVVRVVHYGII